MASHPEWDEYTPATLVASTFADQIRGKIVLITGISPSSLGESMAMSIASSSPSHLLLASRTPSKITSVLQRLQSTYATLPTRYHPITLDLSSQASIRTAASEISSLVSHIDVLINNAGVMVVKRSYTSEGIELQFGTNHLGGFLLTHLLLPKLVSASQRPDRRPGETRVINVTSQGHRLSPIRFSDYNIEKPTVSLPESERPVPNLPAPFLPRADNEGDPQANYSGFVAYGQCKTANILFALSFNKHFASPSPSGHGLRAFAVHPGSIWTDLSRNLDEAGRRVIETTGVFWKDHDQGAATMLVGAFDPALDLFPLRVDSGGEQVADEGRVGSGGGGGYYMSDCQIIEPAAHASDEDAAQRLWDLSLELTALGLGTKNGDGNGIVPVAGKNQEESERIRVQDDGMNGTGKRKVRIEVSAVGE